MERRSESNEDRVLILAPTGRDASVLSDMLAKGTGGVSRVCASIDELCACIREGAGTGIVADEVLTDEAVRALAGVLAEQPEWSDLPLIVMTSGERDGYRTWSALADVPPLVNAMVLERPVYSGALIAAVRTALRSRVRQYQVREELRRRREAEDGLKAANRELESFTHSVSHDLMNPLNSIQAMTDLLRDFYGPSLDEDGKRCIAEIAESRRKMTDIINDLLRLSRISRQELTRSNVDLTAIARETIAGLRRRAPERRAETTVQENLRVFADSGLVRVALENLIGNAWKYTAGRDPAIVEVGADVCDGEHCFFVRDNGAGFDMSLSDKLFRPFQRLHAKRTFGGTGVGLSTVKRIIDRHGGRIWATSEPEQGATFYFTLPEG